MAERSSPNIVIVGGGFAGVVCAEGAGSVTVDLISSAGSRCPTRCGYTPR